MQEVNLNTHLIITDIHNEYHMNWCGRVADANPLIRNGKPLFIIIGINGRIESDSIDMKHLEHLATLVTRPKGKAAITSDTSRIYIRQADGSDMLLGIMTHTNVKTFSQMTDKFQKIS